VYSHAYVGTLVGAGLGFALATRGRMRVHNAFLAFQKQAKPVEMVLQDGKHGECGHLSPRAWVQGNGKKEKRADRVGFRLAVPVPDIQFREPGPVAVFASTFFLTTIGVSREVCVGGLERQSQSGR
jgi:hypothetical protein